MVIKNKRGQEEIVGFAVIIIIVAIILLFLLSFYIRGGNDEGVESFEANSFLQSSLHVTTECSGPGGRYHDVQDLIFECSNRQTCVDGDFSCDVLEDTLTNIVGRGWPFEGNRPVRGYELNITSDGGSDILSLSEGNRTSNYREASQDFVRGRERIKIRINFRAYYA
ncbi:MAG: hypothetical protein WDZ69_01105 [Candidatus Pacearchaeota archaeon]